MLTPLQIKTVGLLCKLTTQKEVCEAAGISDTTLRNWLRKPEFLKELRSAQRWYFKEILRELLKTQSPAIKALIKLTSNPDPEIVHKASKTLLDHLHPAFLADESLTSVEHSESVSELGEGDSGEEFPTDPKPESAG